MAVARKPPGPASPPAAAAPGRPVAGPVAPRPEAVALSAPPPGERSVLMVGSGEPVGLALTKALHGRSVHVETVPIERVGQAAVAVAPDLVLVVGDAARDAGAAVARALQATPAAAVVPMVTLADGQDLGGRLAAFRHGAAAVVVRQSSVAAMADEVARLCREIPERAGGALGELGESTLEEFVQTLARELRSGILSVHGGGEGDQAVRLVLDRGRPLATLIDAFVGQVRGQVRSAEPLRWEFDERAAGTVDALDLVDDAATHEASIGGLRVVLADDDAARADAVAQELRARGARLVVCDLEPSDVHLARLRQHDPAVLVIGATQLHGKGFGLLQRLRADTRLRWASLLVVSWEEIWSDGELAPLASSLIQKIVALSEVERTLAASVAKGVPFDTRLEVVGPARLLRILADSGATLRLTLSHPRFESTLHFTQGLLAGGEGRPTAGQVGPDGRPATAPRPAGSEGLPVVSTWLVLASGRVHIEPVERVGSANVMAPIDVALAQAEREGVLITPSLFAPRNRGALDPPIPREPPVPRFKGEPTSAQASAAPPGTSGARVLPRPVGLRAPTPAGDTGRPTPTDPAATPLRPGAPETAVRSTPPAPLVASAGAAPVAAGAPPGATPVAPRAASPFEPLPASPSVAPEAPGSGVPTPRAPPPRALTEDVVAPAGGAPAAASSSLAAPTPGPVAPAAPAAGLPPPPPVPRVSTPPPASLTPWQRELLRAHRELRKRGMLRPVAIACALWASVGGFAAGAALIPAGPGVSSPAVRASGGSPALAVPEGPAAPQLDLPARAPPAAPARTVDAAASARTAEPAATPDPPPAPRAEPAPRPEAAPRAEPAPRPKAAPRAEPAPHPEAAQRAEPAPRGSEPLASVERCELPADRPRGSRAELNQALAEAKKAVVSGDLARMQRAYCRAVELRADEPAALTGLITAFYLRGDGAQALEWARRAVALLPDDETLKGLLADSLALSGDLEAARKVVLELEGVEDQPRAIEKLATRLGGQAQSTSRQSPARAERLYRRALIFWPGNAGFALGLSRALDGIGDRARAAFWAERAAALRLDPGNAPR